MKVRKLNKVRFLDYCNRAEEFFEAMKDEVIFERYNASALLGIHASIALADSLTVYESGKRAADEQHMDAVKLLKNVCNTKGVSGEGPNQLGKILSKKNFIAYEEHFRAVDRNELKSIRLNVERFFIWIYKNFRDFREEFNKGGQNEQ